MPIYPDFLKNDAVYKKAEQFWLDLWGQVDEFSRRGFGWSYPWVGTGSPSIKDGNPIFSSHSPALRRGVRIIQVEPIDSELDIQVWLSTFGGDAHDPDSIRELVIACVLSETAAEIALTLMSQWVMNSPTVDFNVLGAGCRPMTIDGFYPEIEMSLGLAA